jgi:hypothetical protein
MALIEPLQEQDPLDRAFGSATLGQVTSSGDAMERAFGAPSGPDRLKTAQRAAQETTPETAARVLKLQNQTGLPQGFIEQNLDDLTKQAAVQGVDWGKFRKETPRLAEWLAANPLNAAIAQDDHEQLGTIERILTGIRALGAGVYSAVPSTLGFLETYSKLPAPVVEGAPVDINAQILNAPPRTSAVTQLLEDRRRLTEAALNTIRGKRENVGPLEGAVYSGLESIGQSAALLPLGVFGEGAALLGMGVTTAGQAMTQATDEGVAPLKAFGFGSLQGVIEAATEAAPVHVILDRFKVRGKFSSFLLKELGAELPGEQVATLLQDLNEWAVLPENKAKTFQDYLDARPSAAAQTLVATVVGSLGTTGIVHVVTRAVHGKSPQQLGLEELGKAVQESKTGQRLAPKLAEFVGAVDDSRVYLDAEDVKAFAQDQKIDPAAFLENVTPGAGAQYQQALAAGQSIAIPMADYATKIANSESAPFFNGVARMGDPERMNARELQAAMDETGDSEVQTSADEVGAQDSAAKVREDITGQLLGLGYRPEAVDAYAQYEAAKFQTMADRAGVDPFALYEQYKLKITRPLPDILTTLPNIDTRLDTMIDRLRAGELPSQQEMFGKSLLEFIHAKGGLKDEGGELKSLEPDADRKPFQKNLIQPKTGLPLDRAREAAAEEGYLDSQSTIGDLLDLIDKELRGEPVYAQQLHNAEAVEQSQVLSELDQYLKSRDVDVRTASNDDIKQLLQEAARPSPEGTAFDQAAYHGSPHLFDKFSLQKIGTGEGAQSYGWGLYFAGNKEVAEYYRNALARTIVTLDGQQLQWDRSTPTGLAVSALRFTKGDIPKALAELKSASYRNRDQRTNYEAAHEWLSRHADRLTTTTGRLYTVDIPEDSEYLDWDKPLSEQSEKVRSALGPIIERLKQDAAKSNPEWGDLADPAKVEGILTGRDLYRAMTDTSFSGKRFDLTGKPYTPESEVSQTLASLGIPGIKYLDQGSRTEGQGSYNYVLFNDQLAKITSYEQQTLDLEKRGRIVFGNDRQFTIQLLEKADLSTFVHEMAHFHLEVFGDLVDILKQRDPATLDDKQQRMIADYGTILNWLGVKSREQIGREQHEQWARGNEAYLREGNAPSPELRSIFNRFASWLRTIYRQLTQLNVTLTPEVRGVMDRLVASDEQIDRARQEAEILSMIEDQGQAERVGMSPDEFRLYKDDVQRASDAQKEALFGEYMDEYNRYQADWYQARRTDVRNEVTAEVHSQHDYIALTYLQKGTLPDGSPLPNGLHGIKLDGKALKKEYSKSVLDKLRRLDLYRLKDGVHPDMVAETLSYSSGDEMIQRLLKLRPMNELIEAETDDRMRQQYGDMLTDGTAPEKARDAVMTIGRSEVIEAELKALAKKVRETSPFVKLGERQGRQADQAERGAGMRDLRTFIPSVQLARDVAERRIAALRVRDVQAGTYYAAARRESLKAVEAVNKGNFQAALAAKQKELINVEMYRAATQTQREVEKARDYMRSFDDTKKRARIGKAGESYLDQIDALLDRFDFKKISGKQAERRKSLLEWVADQQAKGLPVNLPAELLNEARKQNYQDLSVEELRGLRDGLEMIEHFAGLKNTLLKAKDKRELDAAVAEIVQRIGTTPASGRDLRTRENAGALDTLEGWSRSSVAMHRKMSSLVFELDGFEMGGPLWDHFIQPMNESGNREATMREEAAARLMPLLKPVLAQGPMGGKGQYFDSVKMSFNREERLAIALNAGNASNVQRLLGGENWTRQQIQPILDSLTKADWDFVQGVWDHFETYRDEAFAMEQRINGVRPEAVEATPVVTAFGTFRGGYYPVKFDPARSQHAEQHAAAEDAKAMLKGAYTSSTTRQSYVKERVAEVKGRPLVYSLRGLYQGTTEVIHDLAWREWLIDANRLLRDPKLDKAIRERKGPEGVQVFKAGIEAIARGEAQAATAFDRFFDRIRKGATVSGLAWNAVSALKQLPDLSFAAVRIGKSEVAHAIVESMASPLTTARMINDKSEFMRNRASTMQRDINDIRNTVGGKSEFRETIENSFFILTEVAQRTVDVPTWLAQYNKSITAGESEQRAVSLADQAVLDTMGGGQVKDLAQIQQGPAAVKLFTMFYHGFAAQYQITAERTQQARRVFASEETARAKAVEALSLSMDYMLMHLPAALLGAGLVKILRGDDDESWTAALLKEGLGNLLGLFVGVREFEGAAEKLLGFKTHDYAGPTGLRLIGETEKLATQIQQGELDDALRRSAINAAGVVTQLPAGQINRTIDGMEAVMDGRTSNPAVVVFGSSKK